MRKTNHTFLIAGASAIALAFGGTANAQDATTASSDDTMAEAADETDAQTPAPADENVIVVSGIRQSLENALRAKRDSDQVLDAISAEDIGKFPDKNVGEALQRVTGVQISRTNGEGSGVSIRGASPDLNRVEMNGVSMLGTQSGSRAVDFRDIPVEFVNRLEVVKSVTPDMTEGGLGGTVRIITRRPFDSKEDSFIAGSAQGIYSEIGDTLDPKLALIGSKRFADDTMGILLSATYERRRIETHTTRTTGWRQITDPDTGELYDLDGNGNPDFFPEIPRYSEDVLDTKRIGLNGVFEYKPTDDLHAYVEGTYTRSKQDLEAPYFQLFSGGALVDAANSATGEDDTVSQVTYLNNGSAPYLNLRTIRGDITRYNWSAAGGVDYTPGQWEIGVRTSFSKAQIDNDYVNTTADVRGLDYLIVNYDNAEYAPEITLPFDYDDSSAINYVRVQHRPVLSTQEEFMAKGDVARNDLTDWLTQLKAGVQYRRTTLDNKQWDANIILDGYSDPSLLDEIQSYADLLVPIENEFFNTGSLGGFSVPAWLYDDGAFSSAIGVPDPYDNPTLSATYDVVEKNLAGYLQGSFTFDLGVPFYGVVGARVVQTKTTANGYQSAGGVFSPVSFDGDYVEFLPALNLRADIIPNKLLFRGSATEVLARPNPTDLAPRLTLDIVGFSGSRGNPDLQPYRARQYDAGLEYYIDSVSFVSATYFRKEISSFIERTTVNETYDGQVYAINLPVNGSAAVTVNGLEIGGQLSFSTFTDMAVVQNFGVIANFTYSKDSGYEGTDYFTGEQLPFPGLSRKSYNLSLYYEDDLFSLRGSYNWRSKYLINAVGRGNNPEFGEAAGQLDVSASVNVTDNISVFFEGVNLTDEMTIQNANSTYRRIFMETYGPRYYGGVRFRF
ncbi:TonB-dependent receptor [Croceicoccus mobilis]|uniref:TonB-dependent receptor n=1 Tax=Croceicoccus mobilis TaxID=1703339 RepID=A0A917DY28_9SPHN|nr:TonB-dependent receptor [Croceicoccus mobilis]GGD82479.1 TonB-dependent receptor [Croceicoccus mobilis]